MNLRSIGTADAAVFVAFLLHPAASRGQQSPPLNLAFIDRGGTTTRIGALPPDAFAPRLSPDSSRITFDNFDGTIWIADIANIGKPWRFGSGRFPMWSPDGSKLIFAVSRDLSSQLAGDGGT
jgi:Tol biopolymer transport system component